MNALLRTCLPTILVLALLQAANGVSAQKPKPAPSAAQKPRARPAPTPAAKPPASKQAAAPKPAGLVMRMTYTAADGRTSDTKLTSNGIRQRVDLGDGVAVITQCDTKRTLQVSDKARTFVAVATDAATPVSSPASASKGGVIEYVTKITDTGERKEIFGLQAKHFVTTVTKTPSPNACDRKWQRVETDGWYGAVPVHIACDLAQPSTTPPTSDCRDEQRSSVVGDPPAGAPLAYTITTFGDDGKVASKVKMAVAELTVGPVDVASLDAPSDYSRAEDAKAFVDAVGRAADEERWGAPKAAGTIRVGVLAPSNKSGQDVSIEALRKELLDALSVAPYEAVPIVAPTAADQAIEAKKKECDYVMSLDLAALKSSTPGKVGGLLRRASGGGSPSELHEAKVEYRVFAAGAAKPLMAKSASAKSGAFTLKRALGIARLAAQLYFGAGTGMMRMMLAETGGTGGGLPGLGGDPSMNAMSFVLGVLGGGADAPVDETSREATITAAIRGAATDILKELAARKTT